MGPPIEPPPGEREQYHSTTRQAGCGSPADPGEAAATLAGLIREEHADVLLSYDAQGSSGHRDHMKVHEVGARAAEMMGVRVLAATLPRELVLALFNLMRLLKLVTGHGPQAICAAFTPRSAITHSRGRAPLHIAEARGSRRS